MTGAIIRILSEAETEQAFPPAEETVALVEDSLKATRTGTTEVPPKAGLKPESGKGFFHWMPFIDRSGGTGGVKWVSYFPGNAEKGLVDSHALILLCDGQTGYPEGLVGGMGITGLRTAAGAIVGARPFQPKPRSIALVGCGRIQATTARFITETFPALERVTVYARTQETREAFCATQGKLFRPAATVREATAEADIVISCIPQVAKPVLGPEDFKPGAVFVPLDVTASWSQGVYEASDAIFADNVDQAKIAATTRRPDMQLDLSRIAGMGDILLGRAEPPRSFRLLTSIVTGTAETDLFVARRVLERAAKMNLGTVVPFG
jgi:ornithine cyclodeaminase/alanine dehydrogenase-like protein (mu-crystallin family)